MNRFTSLDHAQWLRLSALALVWLGVVGLRFMTNPHPSLDWYLGMAFCTGLSVFIGWKARGYVERNGKGSRAHI